MKHVKEDSKVDAKVIFALTLVHFTGDFYASFINPLLPVFMKQLSLTLTQVGLITGITRFLSFVVQPSVGYVVDRYRTRIFVLGGPLLAAVCIPLVGIAHSFAILIAFIALGSIGQAMFHPSCAGMVPAYSGQRSGLCMSIFLLGGTFAFGVGPLFISYFVTRYGLGASPVTMVLGLALTALLFRIVPLPVGEGLENLGFIGTLRDSLGTVWKSMMILWVIMVLRSFAGQSFLTFIPVLYATEGYSLISIGTIISLFTVGGALSGLLAGHLSDRIGYKSIFYVSHSLATLSLYLLLSLPGHWIYPCAFLSGFLLLATLPLAVVMAQELAPKGKSMVSSLMMGLAFGTGGMMTPLTGKLAEIFSIRPVLIFIAVVPLLTTGLIALLPGKALK
jgi:FSR family fosmidomycin resistance protein-like MFS transporter